MATRETRRQRGRRRGEAVVTRLVDELRDRRLELGLSQRALATELGWSQSVYARFERRVNPGTLTVLRFAEVAALLGLELSCGLHPAGDPLRDKGHQALIGRFRRLLARQIGVMAEVPFPGDGDQRVWDLLLRHGDALIGVEAETRIRDLQALVRRIRARERDGGADQLILVLSDSAVNRRLVGQLREALGERFATSPRRLIAALHGGELPILSGVLLV